MQKFILPHIETPPCQATITGQDARHICRVLRLKPGDPLSLCNGRGKDYEAVITSCNPDKVTLEIIRSEPSLTESLLDMTLCTGMLKDKKMDLILKHVTQLGITRWVPFYCSRSVPKPDKKRIEKRLDRWQTIARESVKQCRRSRVPDIERPVSFDEILSMTQEADLKVAFWENATLEVPPPNDQSPVSRAALLIGPEGGFSEAEIDLASAHGFRAMSLGPRILRAETAAISGCTLIQHLFGDM